MPKGLWYSIILGIRHAHGDLCKHLGIDSSTDLDDFDTQVSGGQDKLAWTAYPPPLQLSIKNNPTKKSAEFDLNYVLD